MGVNTYERDMQYYLKHRTPVNAKCMKPGTEPVDPMKFCSMLIITDDPECYCQAYINPDAKWRIGDCMLADTFLKSTEEEQVKGKTRVGQQKQSKKNRNRR